MNTQVKHNHLLVLGSGTSTGVPMVGCRCSICLSTDSRDKRFRSSVLLRTSKQRSILIDTTTDLRSQLIDNAIDRVDLALITHDHADHVHGMDDLRPLGFIHPSKERIPIYASEETSVALTARFPYIFTPTKKPIGGGIPRLRLCPIAILEDQILQTDIGGETFHLFILPHGNKKTLGFCHEKFAYLVDCQSVPEKVIELLSSFELDLLIIECVQPQGHDTHLGIDKAFDIIRKIGPKAAGLTHIGHQFQHQALLDHCHNIFDFPVFPLADRQELTYSNKSS